MIAELGHAALWLAAALSVSYAFCGFALLFYQNMVWLDMMYLFNMEQINQDMIWLQLRIIASF